MKEMAKHIPDTGSYAPVSVLIDERSDGVHLSYDTMASLLMPYGNAKALEVARQNLRDRPFSMLSLGDHLYIVETDDAYDGTL